MSVSRMISAARSAILRSTQAMRAPNVTKMAAARSNPIQRQTSNNSNADPASRADDGMLCAPEGDLYHQRYKVREIENFEIVDSTLREGEQFATTYFTTDNKIHIAKQLDELGVEYIEIMNPLASEQSAKDCEIISGLGLNAKIACHVRCHPADVSAAVDRGIQVIHMYMATSKALKDFSHGKSIDDVIEDAKAMIDYCVERGVEVRFSAEDTFRSNIADLIKVYTAVDRHGVNRIGLADTVGVASPLQVFDTVNRIRSEVGCDIEFHTHNDTGCCISNALVALQGGVTHVDTSVLGIGERNGITPLGGFLARMYTYNEFFKDRIINKYNLSVLKELEEYVADCAGVQVPFNNYITGWCAFTHKAGVHSKAVLQNPAAYEVINPDHFGVCRDVKIAHRLTGWNAVQQRALQLGLDLSEKSVKEAARYIKNLADTRNVGMPHLDQVLINLRDKKPCDFQIDSVPS